MTEKSRRYEFVIIQYLLKIIIISDMIGNTLRNRSFRNETSWSIQSYMKSKDKIIHIYMHQLLLLGCYECV